jgi:hypothetical protein
LLGSPPNAVGTVRAHVCGEANTVAKQKVV